MTDTHENDILEQSIETLKGIGPKRAALLGNLRLFTIADLLRHFPRDYRDRRDIRAIGEIEEGQEATVRGTVVQSRLLRLRRNLTMAEVTVRDESGEIKATWFGRGFLVNSLKEGVSVILTGKAGNYKGLALKNPDYEILPGEEDDTLHTGRIVPLYPLTEGVSQRMFRQWTATALDQVCAHLEDPLPEALGQRHGFLPLAKALQSAHYPATLEDAEPARARFAYEELLAIQIAVLGGRKRRRAETGHRHIVDGPTLEKFREGLPFGLTAGQQRAVEDILGDMASPRSMARLIQGDVGCGKTIVAFHAIAAAADGGYQTALMAPTEILAEQHFLSLSQGLTPLGLSVELLTGSTPRAAGARERIAGGRAQIAVGTHALFQEKTQFHRLGLVIIDEQHRFGVLQRARLGQKGAHPDLLHMTATPIPRTLVMTLYGGMDLSTIDEMPPGRRPIRTQRVTPAKVAGLYRHILDEAKAGRQTYFICPLVEESESSDLRAVVTHFQELSQGPLSSIRSALLHGRLRPAAKEQIMMDFQRGEVDVLFSTTVIEVGIDVASATTMVIEDAWRFGLTQLHQLRGRIGRGKDESNCYLLGAPKTGEGKARVKILCQSSSGFEIAEEDLRLRGPGEFQGLRQAGLTDLRVADLVRDARLLAEARRDARELLEADPDLTDPAHQGLKAAARRFRTLAV